ncbi:hypothetical protein I4J47_11535 [Corynebacterium belfantii]|uniref:hypothetical protein n=1 Tax=Corynebacterium belfantii TaxID=2014537 RepID=UPI0018D383C8|nr:hypothetical protein [Corynebacterium belfantii]MBG9331931.1 hypothetical protein [Corynebacterium belfantii]
MGETADDRHDEQAVVGGCGLSLVLRLRRRGCATLHSHRALVIFCILLILFSVRRFYGRIEELFDFNDDYAPLQQTWNYYQQASSQQNHEHAH